jgi:hypothetical protein
MFGIFKKKPLNPTNLYTSVTLLLFTQAASVHAQPTERNVIDWIVSTASFLEQCSARGILQTEGVQNEVLQMAESLGWLAIGDYWLPLQRGADGEVYDIIKGKWIRMNYNDDTCRLVLGEQIKLRENLSRRL